MPQEQGENQHLEERGYRQEITKHEAPVLVLDPLLDLALEEKHDVFTRPKDYDQVSPRSNWTELLFARE
jgi:hypothetical protein